jgi:hypothetical protein
LVTIASLDRAPRGGTRLKDLKHMIECLRGLGLACIGAALLGASALAQPAPIPPAPIPGQSGPPPSAADMPASNPACVRLEGQLAMVNRGSADQARADQIKRLEDSIGKQQNELDRLQAQSRKAGCEGGGFFALFTGQSPQCQPLTAQIGQKRDDLDRAMSDLERVKSGNNSDVEGQRRQLIGQLAQNNCGEQYRAAAAAAGPGGFLDSLFSGHIISPGGDGAPSGTYRTVCVRSCDGYFFPISYSTVPTKFADDQRACLRECPYGEVSLYTYRNPGEDMEQAVSSSSGAPYTALPNAFRYRKEVVTGCSCRRAGQTWADALKGADDATTLESGDIVVTDQNAKALSQPPQAAPPKGAKTGKAGANGQAASAQSPSAQPAADGTATASDQSKGGVRTVGPPFVAGH